MSNANQQTGNGPTIEDKLYRTWKQQQRFYHLRGLSRLLIWAVVLILVDLLVDWQIFFRSRISGPTVLLLLVNVSILGWVLWHEWLRHLKRFDPVRVSLEVESKHPELLSVLVTYTQLKGPAAESSNASPALLGAMRGQAIRLTRPLDFREVVDFGQLRNLLVAAVCCVVFFTAVSSIWSEHMRSLLLRLVGVAAPYPTQTQIVDVTGDLTIRQGDSVEIVVKAEGKIPQAGRLFVRFQSDPSWQPLALPATKGNALARDIPEIYEDLTYYVQIGDAVSDRYSVSVSPPPEIVQSKIFLKYPKYLAEGGDWPGIAEAPPVEDLNLSVPERTSMRWELRCRPAVRSLEVKIGDETINAKIEADGTKAVFDYVAEKDFKYTFHWTEKEHGFTYDDVQHVVRVIEDKAPDVELIQPSGDAPATVNKTLELKARAADDHGLAGAVLVYSVNGSAERRVTIQDVAGTSKDIRYTWALADALTDLKDGDNLALWIEVSDGYRPRAHTRISATRRLSIVSDSDYLKWFKKELDAQRERILQARDSEKKATAEVARLKVEEKEDSN